MPGLNILRKKVLSITGPGITLTNIEIKDITKIIESLENRKILLKGTSEKVIDPKWRFLGSLISVAYIDEKCTYIIS